MEKRPELQDSLVEFLFTLPLNKIGIWAVSGWDSCIPKDSTSRPRLIQFLKEIREETENSLVRAAVEKNTQE